MKYSPAQVIQYYLIAVGVGQAANSTAAGFKVYRDSQPPDPDEVITVYDTVPTPDGRDMRTNEVIRHPGIQIRIRALKSDAGKSKGGDIEAALTALKQTKVIVLDKQYLVSSFVQTSGLTPLGQEEQSNRQLYVVNGTVTLAELP